ncbi:ComEC/Rec2 family competence protein [Treponema sp. C6A8]|uniref:ComEC/Rec2 family competence protein n=1 Tax=Treponema sp. C6A8 TaxID=1410609 RepID=UPI00068867C6|nr:ComEC/Rec2 family competence protein [Treponema sp. C6A8]
MAIKLLEKPFFTATLICILIFYSNSARLNQRSRARFCLEESAVSSVEGEIISSPAKTQSGKYYICKLSLNTVYGKVSDADANSSARGIITLLIPSELAEVYFPGKLYTAANNKGAFLYESGALYNFKGSFSNSVFIAKDCRTCSWKKGIYGRIDYFRALCRLQFKRLMYAWGNAGGLLLALLCGSREYLEPVLYSNFRTAGLSHIIALSGMHLSMFSAIALFFGSRFGRKKLTFIIRVTALILFVWFAGFSPSLLRAFICSMLLLFAAIAGVKEPDMLMILCFSFLLQCILSPSDLVNAGFMLSYGALAGILITSRFLTKIIMRYLPPYFSLSLSASCGAQIFTAPLSLKLFGSFSPIGVIATVFVSPLITIFIYSGLLFIILSLIFPHLSSYSAFFLAIEYNFIKIITGAFSQAPLISFGE